MLLNFHCWSLQREVCCSAFCVGMVVKEAFLDCCCCWSVGVLGRILKYPIQFSQFCNFIIPYFLFIAIHINQLFKVSVKHLFKTQMVHRSPGISTASLLGGQHVPCPNYKCPVNQESVQNSTQITHLMVPQKFCKKTIDQNLV